MQVCSAALWCMSICLLPDLSRAATETKAEADFCYIQYQQCQQDFLRELEEHPEEFIQELTDEGRQTDFFLHTAFKFTNVSVQDILEHCCVL
jgi:hypothetical protein